MQPRLQTCAIALLLLFGVIVSAVAADSPPFHPGRILVIPKPGRENAADDLHRNYRAQVRSRLSGLPNIQLLELPAGADVVATANAYRRSGDIEAAEPDYLRRATVLPNDPYFTNGSQWHLDNTGQSGGVADADIDAPEAWDIANSASNVVVAVLDTGVLYTHEDLAENIWTNSGEIPGNGIDDDNNGVIDDIHGFTVFSGDVNDHNGHGTHVAGILGGVGNNGLGISGVAWRVQIMICKFLDSGGHGYDSDAIRCINYARTNGAHILNCSWGSESSSSVLRSAIDSVRSAGILVVAAAGNDPSSVHYPASFALDNVLGVGATTRSDVRASYSAVGDIYAPGSDIRSTYFSSDASYRVLSGTSMAAPCVAGAAAILLGAFPNEPYTNIIDRLTLSSDHPGGTVLLPRLNLANALQLVAKARFRANRYSGVLPLAVDFTEFSFGQVTNRLWNFGDGTLLTNVLNPAHTFNSTGVFQVVLTITATNGVTSSATQSLTATHDFPYIISQARYDWISNGLATLVLTNDIRSPPQTLPFAFEFYGKPYSQIYLFSYGLAGFDPPWFDSFNGSDLPRTSVPNAIICPYWMWMKATNAGALTSGQYGIAPHRKAVFSWTDVHQVNTPTDRFTFQIILHESGHVTMQYKEVENASSFNARGKSASIGIEDDRGLVAAKYTYYGVPNLVSNRQAIAYTPPGYVPTPPRLQPTSGPLPGQFNLRAYTAPGHTCILETSGNLAAWTALFTNTVPASGIFQFTLTNAPPSHQFYRLVLP
jgi:subtilisin family serine protease